MINDANRSRHVVELNGVPLCMILRQLMYPPGIGYVNVLDRQWKVLFHFGGSFRNGDSLEQDWLFPEYTVFSQGTIVSGERLLERSATVFDFEETFFQRLIRDSSDEWDMEIDIDTGDRCKITCLDSSEAKLLQELADYAATIDVATAYP